MFTTGTCLSALFVVLLIKVLISKICAPKAPLPPGPKRLPLIGNLFDLPNNLECRAYHEWSKDLNTDILYLNVLGSSIIVLDTYEASVELMDKRSSIYSGRKRMPMINELMGYDFHFAFMDYGDTWRQHRKIMHHGFNATAVKEFRPHQIKAVRGLLKRLLDEPDDVVKEIQLLSGEIILSVTYGIDVQSSDDPYIKMAEAGVRPVLEAALPGAFLVDTFPLLKFVPSWFPGAGFKRKASEWRKLAQNMINIPYSVTKEAITNGAAKPSFVSRSLDNFFGSKEDMKVEEEAVKLVAGTMYQAGSDTTSATVASCILALLEHPDVVKKTQEEIDSVVHGRLPNFDDEESLPYLTAVIKEALRWRVVGPIGLPHTVGTDDIYNGYRIPAGSVVMANVWAILNDEKIFPNPELFIPERFMKNDEVVESRLEVSWGYGRRVCPGRYMAFSTVWIALASILAVFEISKPVDKHGNVIHPSHKYSNSVLPFPYPFKAIFKPRNKGAEDLIRSGIDSQDNL